MLLLSLAAAASADDRSVIELDGHRVSALGSDKDISTHLETFAGGPGSELKLVKFAGPITAEQRKVLEASVDRVYSYFPHDAFLVRASADKQAGLEAKVGAEWTVPFHPAYKIGRGVEALIAKGHSTLDLTAGQGKALMVHVLPDADLDELTADLLRLGAKVVGAEQRSRFSRLRLVTTAAELRTLKDVLALRPEVLFFDLEARRVLLNDTTAWVSQTGVSGGQQTPIHNAGILGEGQIVGVLDTGIDPDMCFFRDTVNGLPPRNECNGGTTVNLSQRKVIAVDFLYSGECSGGISSNEWDNQDHGTHVAGTIAGDNFANPGTRDSADGMAPAAKLVVQDGGFATDNCADLPALGCPVVDLNPIFQQAYNQGARIHSNSWGDDENNPVKGLYTAGSEDSDEFMWNHKDFLLVYAAGNDGPGNGRIGSPATAKNVVSVGATLRGSSAQSMASFSSCGPTDDGRIKPDVTLPGSSIISANSDNNIGSNNCNTKSSSGTSMAAPGVAGAAALVREYYVDGFYPSGVATPADSLSPSAALLKATLINSGQDMSGVSGWPANCEGWGRVALDDSLELSGDSRELIVDDNSGFAQGSSNQTVTYQLSVDSAGEPLKVTLTWTDYPSTPSAGTDLVNDLDLEVSGPSGPWKGNVFSGGASTTGGSADRLNTVEQVRLASPTPGNYTVTVRSFSVPQGPQPFALVVSGDVTECNPSCGPGNTAPSVSITSPSNGSSVTAGTSVAFAGSATDAEDGNLSSSLSWTSSLDGAIGSGASFSSSSLSVGSHSITASVSDSGGLSGNDVIGLTVTPVGGGNGPQDAVYNSGLGAPSCAVAGSECDSLALLNGRANLGPEPNQPNTLGSCTDGTSGSYHSDESVDKIVVSTLDGGDFSVGDTVQVDVTVYAYSTGSSDTLDLYYAANANSPSWVLIGSTTAPGGGVRTMSSTYTLPSGSLQAVRANFRYQGSASTCGSGNYDDTDDLVFAVEGGGANTAPTVTITAPTSGGTVNQGASVAFTGTATDSEDGNLAANLSWSSSLDGVIGSGASFSTSGLSVGSHTVTASVTDSGGLSDSDAISITVQSVGGSCAADEDFTSGINGWTTSGTCSTGTFVTGVPTQIVNGGVTTQLAGDHTTGSGNALFTAPNSSAGNADVDGGTCTVTSPTYAVSAASNVSVWYFFGQRDAGDDANDGFLLEMSTNGGSTWSTLQSYGDVTVNAAWTQATTTVGAGSNVVFRVSATDANGGGDLIEAGIDDVTICP